MNCYVFGKVQVQDMDEVQHVGRAVIECECASNALHDAIAEITAASICGSIAQGCPVGNSWKMECHVSFEIPKCWRKVLRPWNPLQPGELELTWIRSSGAPGGKGVYDG